MRWINLEFPDWDGEALLPPEDGTRAALASQPGIDQYLGALTGEPSPRVRISLGGETLDVTGTRDEIEMLVESAYRINGRVGVAMVREALSRAQPLAARTSSMEGELASQQGLLLAELRDTFVAVERALSQRIAVAFGQVEDAALLDLLQALERAGYRLAADRLLLTQGHDGGWTFARGPDGKLVPRALQLVETCKDLVALDAGVRDARQELLLVGAAQAAAPITRDPEQQATQALAILERFALLPANPLTTSLVDTLRAFVTLVRRAREPVEDIQARLFQLVKARTQAYATARLEFAFVDRVIAALGTTFTSDDLAAAAHRAIEDADAGRASVIQRIERGRFATLRADIGPAPRRYGDDIRTRDNPEAVLASLIELVHRERGSPVWLQSTLILDAIRRRPDARVLEVAYAEVQRALARSLRTGVVDQLLQIGGLELLAAVAGPLATGPFIVLAIKSVVDAFGEFARYIDDVELEDAAMYLREGLVTVDPAIAPAVLAAIGTLPVLSLGRLVMLAKLLDVYTGGVIAYELLRLFVEEDSP